MPDGSLESVFADQIEEGDKLISWTGSKMTEEAVIAVERVREKSAWAPLTIEGTLLVDDLLTSCCVRPGSCSCQDVPKNAPGRSRIFDG